MSDTFQFLTLGVGDAFTEKHYHTSFVLMRGEQRVMVDCPEPFRKIIHEASQSAGVSMRIEDVSDIILTHLHADHCSAFESICHYKRHRQGSIPRLHTSPEVLEVLWEKRLHASMCDTINMLTGQMEHHTPDEYFETHEMSYEEPNQVGPFTVEIRRTKHMIPTVGLKIHLDGLSLGYACDTIFDPDHIDWLSPCDMIIHETNVGPHTHLEELMALPQELKDKIWLVHYPDDLEVETAPLKCLRQGRLYTVSRAPRGAALTD